MRTSSDKSTEATRPFSPRLSARLCYGLGRVTAPNRLWRSLGRVLSAHRGAYRAFNGIEHQVKRVAFGCVECGQCALPHTGYACPMSCPKELRNGPCGGVRADGGCEVYPARRCVWLIGYERARDAGELASFAPLIRPADHRRIGESSWVNYWRGRDDDLAAPLPIDGSRSTFHPSLVASRR